MTIEMRRAAEADIAELRELFLEVDSLHHGALPMLFRDPADISRGDDFIVEILSGEDNLLMIAEKADHVIGFVHAVVHVIDHPILRPERVVHIHDIVLTASERGTGVAARLLAQVERWATEQRADQIQLNVFEFNERARGFYEKCGFTTVSRRMGKRLTPTKRDGE